MAVTLPKRTNGFEYVQLYGEQYIYIYIYIYVYIYIYSWSSWQSVDATEAFVQKTRLCHYGFMPKPRFREPQEPQL